MLWARRLAVETEVAFGLPPDSAHIRIVGTLAGDQAEIALVARHFVFLQAEDGIAGKHAEHRAQRRDPTPTESSVHPVECQHDQ